MELKLDRLDPDWDMATLHGLANKAGASHFNSNLDFLG